MGDGSGNNGNTTDSVVAVIFVVEDRIRAFRQLGRVRVFQRLIAATKRMLQRVQQLRELE